MTWVSVREGVDDGIHHHGLTMDGEDRVCRDINPVLCSIN